MKNWSDVIDVCKFEIDRWFQAQCQNQYKRFYWQYTETTSPDTPGNIWINTGETETPGFYLHQLETGDTKEAALSKILKIAGKLPILEY